jgi:hypothetical protein
MVVLVGVLSIETASYAKSTVNEIQPLLASGELHHTSLIGAAL